MTNPILEQYGIHKLAELKKSPFSVLSQSNIEKTPHQVEAFVAALQALKNGGIILADEVGLGKTIEAGLVIKYLIANGAKRILIAMPPPLRKQWQDELKEKFDIDSYIPESKYAVSVRDKYDWQCKMGLVEQYKNKPSVIITGYGMASWFINHFKTIVWDCFIFDEAHRLRNLGNGAKMPKAVFDATRNVPKLLLSATPLQNNLRELYALSQYIDERIFVSETVFDTTYVKTEDYKGLREAITPILHRTLRKDTAEYMTFSERNCWAMDFKLSREEAILYQLANSYLQRPRLFAITTQNSGLVRMVVRKLLASSSFAVAETFEKLRERLRLLKSTTKIEKAETSLKEFFDLIDADDDEFEIDEQNDDLEKNRREEYKRLIDDELQAVENIIQVATKIKENSKANAVIEALKFAFEMQTEQKHPNKALIFTESKRTQKYLIETLTKAGFDKILLFNGELNDPKTKEIYRAWCARNPRRVTNTLSVDLKQAIVEEFQHNYKILIATDAASEGLNLQFCDTVINYDLPWNPMKIEQRIGRCHRYGQKRNVQVFNLLNKENKADERVYEILDKKFNLFKGVFGASDDALGLLESGSNFEKKILEIYDNCRSAYEVKMAFDKLEREIDAKRSKKSNELKILLQAMTSDEKKKHLHIVAKQIEGYFKQVEQWEEVAKDKSLVNQVVMQVDGQIKLQYNKGVENGYLFVGVFADGNGVDKSMPVLAVFDWDGNLVTTDTYEIIQAFKNIPAEAFTTYKPYKSEMVLFGDCLGKLASHYYKEYKNKNESIIEQNRKRLNNWVQNRKGQYIADSTDMRNDIEILKNRKNWSSNFQEKIDIQKEIDKLLEKLSKRDEKTFEYEQKLEQDARKMQAEFEKQFEINGFVIPNLVVKFGGVNNG